MVILKTNPSILKDVDVAVCRKRELFRIWKQNGNEENRMKYCEGKKRCLESSICGYGSESSVVFEKVDSYHDGRELFRIAKQRAGEKRDVIGVGCLKDESGTVKVSVDDRKKI